MNDNLPMIKQDSIFYKIKVWLKKLFSKEELIDNIIEVNNNPNNIEKLRFIDSIKFESNDIILSLQRKLDSGEISVSKLSNQELDEMIELYEKQIKEKNNILMKYKGKSIKNKKE